MSASTLQATTPSDRGRYKVALPISLKRLIRKSVRALSSIGAALNAAFAFVLTLSLVARAIVPDGYMLAHDEQGAMTMQICTAGMEMRYVSVDPATGLWVESDAGGHIPSEPHDDDGSEVCEFSILTSAADAPSDNAIALPVAFGLPMLGSAVYIAASHVRPVLPPLPARGPPTHV